jgi:hypothetical protein
LGQRKRKVIRLADELTPHRSQNMKCIRV